MRNARVLAICTLVCTGIAISCSASDGSPDIVRHQAQAGSAGTGSLPAQPDKPDLELCAQQGDCDRDGFGPDVDCDDYSATRGPAAYDFPDDGIDNDCDGNVDNPLSGCETVPTTTPGEPSDFARALDVCPQGVFDPLVRAAWGRIEGAAGGQRKFVSETKPDQVRILRAFGENSARRGQTMIGLSTGPFGTHTPRDSVPLDYPEDPSFRLIDACASIPLKAQDCQALSGTTAPGGVSVQDVAELALWLRVPTNAETVAFDFSFFSTEFNQFWNASLNDAFIVLVNGAEHDGENVALDSYGHGINVNSGFFQLCLRVAPELTQDKRAALTHCAGIDGDPLNLIFGTLRGTWYDGAANTPNDGTALTTDGKRYLYGGGSGWLTGRFAVTPGETAFVRFILHDTFDGKLDSAVLIDAIRWEPLRASGVSRPPK